MEIKPGDFDPMRHSMFRGRPIHALSREEMQDALVQALKRVHELEYNHPSAQARRVLGPPWLGVTVPSSLCVK